MLDVILISPWLAVLSFVLTLVVCGFCMLYVAANKDLMRKFNVLAFMRKIGKK